MSKTVPANAHYLKAGELLVAQRPCVVTTVLGSCVAVTMYNAERRVAAICHAMLPAPSAETGAPARPTAWQYVSLVVPEMLRHFQKLGIPPGRIETKLFGGSDIFGRCRGETEGRCVGAANVEQARAILACAGLVVRAANVGGRCGRKIIFDCRTGAVRLLRLPAMPAAA